MFYVYVFKSLRNGRLYTGSTGNLSRRLKEHNTGQNISTRSKGPYRMIYFDTFADRSEAMRRAMYLKSGRGREELARRCSI